MMASTPSDKISSLCRSKPTVISTLAEDPSEAPSQVAHKLYQSHGAAPFQHPAPKDYREPSAEDLQRAFECGQFGGTRPSDLFLKIWHDALTCLENDPMAGVVSPPLMGSSGVVPFTIIAPLPDICRHMSNLIVRAQHEVFLATNYWKESAASTLITDALTELSKRAGERGSRVVVKVLYDRGSVKQVFNNHLDVTEKEWSASGIALPAGKDIPNIDLEVKNYHLPPLGTFHAKFMIVDRHIALTQSNNIQDNDNMEMMAHLEGPIVQGLYDMAIVSWHDVMKPPMPLLKQGPSTQKPLATFETQSFLDVAKNFPQSVVQNVKTIHEKTGRLPGHNAGSPHYDVDLAAEMTRMQSQLTPVGSETTAELVTAHLNSATKQSLKCGAPDVEPEEQMTPFIASIVHEPVPIALVNRKPYGALNNNSVHVPQNAAWLAAIRYAKRDIFIQSPDINAKDVIPALLAAIRRGIEVTLYGCLGYNDVGELLPGQGGTNEQMSSRMHAELNAEERKLLHIGWYVGKDQVKPLHNKFKQRSCHIKIMIVDSHIAIQGSGNQDTQSWFHSQEVNILLDSQQICTDWLAALRRNQNTHLYGMVNQEDGVWRDAEGKEAKGAMGTNVGHMAWAKGVVGAVQRVRGVGGF